jgi:hypothetical protein
MDLFASSRVSRHVVLLTAVMRRRLLICRLHQGILVATWARKRNQETTDGSCAGPILRKPVRLMQLPLVTTRAGWPMSLD